MILIAGCGDIYATESVEELHRFAAALGVGTDAFQPMNARRHPTYRLGTSLERRVRAIAAGAQATSHQRRWKILARSPLGQQFHEYKLARRREYEAAYNEARRTQRASERLALEAAKAAAARVPDDPRNCGSCVLCGQRATRILVLEAGMRGGAMDGKPFCWDCHVRRGVA